jgi:hypothetical protein
MKPALANEPIDHLLYDYVVPDQQAQELWFSLEKEPWQTLAIVPAASAASTANILKSLEEVAELRGLGSVQTLDCARVGLAEVADAQQKLQTFVSMGHKVLFNTSSPVETPAAAALVRSADAVLLVAHLDRTYVADMQRVVQIVGKERFIGCVTVQAKT